MDKYVKGSTASIPTCCYSYTTTVLLDACSASFTNTNNIEFKVYFYVLLLVIAFWMCFFLNCYSLGFNNSPDCT